ncbi:MAG: peptidoglycan-binding protein [Candidatus Fimivivens sp.]
MSPNNIPSGQSTSRGRLAVNVNAIATNFPVDSATVRIIEPGTNRVIEELKTDSSGLAPTVELAAPPLDYSLEPMSPKPYSEYDVQVEAPDFEGITVNGVQILPDVTALQGVGIAPRVITEGVANTINISQHTLWGVFPPKIPEAAVKPLPETQGYVVLPDPVVPEYIVVHLGRPTATAENVWIPFKDYIKNVASSEIYSTWPRQTIRANVLAILSFVLNRVYTEWYRGKGYDFTITNSTAFDQAFVYGRNVFENISTIVDEIFTTYITKPGIRQPLFSQFCDGVRVQCPQVMEQWGSKELGTQGYDALSILRHYYGSDVFLAQADKVEGVPLSFPGTVLQIGSSGRDVRTIQEQLNSISNHFPKIPKIRVDGVYGPQTVEAVRTFQEIFHLPATGSVDFSTWYEISNIYVAVNKLAEGYDF